jgi:hypothetical protein
MLSNIDSIRRCLVLKLRVGSGLTRAVEDFFDARRHCTRRPVCQFGLWFFAANRLFMAAWNGSVFVRGSGDEVRLSFEIVEVPMWGRLKSIWLILMGENQLKI